MAKQGTFEDNIGVRAIRLAEVFARLARIVVEKPFGLRATELRILNILDGEASLSINEIARRTHVDKGWISRSIRDLEDRNLVQRRSDDNDSRKSHALLSASGKSLLDTIRPFARDGELRMFIGIDERRFKAEMDQLLGNLEDILLDAEAPEPPATQK